MDHIGISLGRVCAGISHISQSTENLTQGSISESIDGQRLYQLLRAVGTERKKKKKKKNAFYVLKLFHCRWLYKYKHNILNFALGLQN